jgi:hypothetical protein
MLFPLSSGRCRKNSRSSAVETGSFGIGFERGSSGIAPPIGIGAQSTCHPQAYRSAVSANADGGGDSPYAQKIAQKNMRLGEIVFNLYHT